MEVGKGLKSSAFMRLMMQLEIGAFKNSATNPLHFTADCIWQ
jgi:hypothetical protein